MTWRSEEQVMPRQLHGAHGVDGSQPERALSGSSRLSLKAIRASISVVRVSLMEVESEGERERREKIMKVVRRGVSIVIEERESKMGFSL